MKKHLILLFGAISIASVAQNKLLDNVTFTGYAEMYYSYDFSNPENHEKDSFLYNHKRHNEINANLLLAKMNYSTNDVRANLALMAGNYAQYNLSAEPTWAQFVYEANIGIKLSKNKNLWLDAGIFPSHIGFESAISADCWTLSRSILAENSPYYEAGLKLNYTNNTDKWNVAFLVLNGWQHIKKPDSIQKPSFGLQVNYKPTEKWVLNYSNFVGTDKPDNQDALRTFHNFFAQYDSKNKIGVITGFDIGTDNNSQNKYGVWFSPVVIVKYQLSNKYSASMRAEYYKDENNIIISTPNKFDVFGFSSNIDYKIKDNVLFRVEGKLFNSKEVIFQNNSTQNYSITTSLSIKI